MSDNSFKKKARRHQQATGVSYARARRQVDTARATAATARAAMPAATRSDAAALLSILGLDSAGAPRLTALWAQRDLPAPSAPAGAGGPLVSTPLGLGADRAPIWLDLNRHALMIGASGAGKSTTLNTLLFALCVQHPAQRLNVVLIDAGHPATQRESFAGFDDYPHITGRCDSATAITALTDLLAQRSAALKSRRQPDLGDHSEALRGADSSASATVPSTVVLVDNAAPMTRNHPAFVDALDSVMRKGRALGISVVVAADQFDLAIAHRFASAAQSRIALRTATLGESTQMVGVSDANQLPPTDPGRGLLCAQPGAQPVPFRAFEVPVALIARVGQQLANGNRADPEP